MTPGRQAVESSPHVNLFRVAKFRWLPVYLASGPAFIARGVILNYAYWGLEGRSTGTPPGPMSFGEIAYLLLNQTQVCLRIGQD